ncbi:hypothetical protein [Aliiruegeria lutimaris]|uniref:HdeA/HdeB family protein n=1 Tax=Aliiruegeria lutimaris TaxID=571298 RepID=A0A1G9G544_9RHOB|nr:hypothetical protein [Aliiruegeria lutimaris]SDK95834.1 hypothetical protein SAMN04488026_106122 [Aliiruegeria lutimaris]
MKKTIIAALVTGLALPMASAALADSLDSPVDNNPHQINVSCYRGAFTNVVAWDRPNPVFIEDLVEIGYSYPEAASIGERICRDIRGVRDGEHRINALRQILRESPPRR